MKIQFVSSIGQPEVFIEKFGDIDFAGSHSFLCLELVLLYLQNNGKWNDLKARKMLEVISEDLIFDGYESSLEYEIDDEKVTLTITGDFG